MARKPLPTDRLRKTGPFSVVLPPDALLTDEQLATLEAAAGVTFSPEHRRRLDTATVTYEEDHAFWVAAPSPGQVGDAIATVANLAKELDDKLYGLATPQPAQQAARSAVQSQAWRLDSDISELHRAVNLLRHAASRAEAQFPKLGTSDRGQKGDPARVRLAASLLEVYRAAGGKGTISNKSGKPSGPFFEFVQAVLRLLGINADMAPEGTRDLIRKAVAYTRNCQKVG